jgi:hypothetical protein
MMQDELAVSLECLLGEPIAGIEKIGAGGNSRVYRVDTKSGSFAAKFYFQRTADGRDRLDAEFSSLRFLWDNHVRCIPQPLVADRDRQIAVCQYIPGSEIPAEHVTEANINQLTDFLASLRALATVPGAAVLPLAAEAAFSVAGIVDNIRARFDLLQGVSGQKLIYQDLTQFLHDQFSPALVRWESRARIDLGEVAYSTEIPQAARTLSPSDFGFHNALLGDDGVLSFLDFEYFGWDDPAKMVSDFLWHPRSTMAETLKDRYADRLMEVFSDLDGLGLRLHAVFPLFGLKWCMILLNEFRPENLARRRFANGSIDEVESVLLAQLNKARNTLMKVEQGMRRFS